MTADDSEITLSAVWLGKGPRSPGAVDMRRRAAVLDLMRVRRSLVFPTFAMIGMTMIVDPTKAAEFFSYSEDDFDGREVGYRLLDGYNDWVLRTTSTVGADRVRLVGVIVPGSTEHMLSQLQSFTSAGVKAVMISSGLPPGGTSPADEALDPFWAHAARSNVPVMLHLGTEIGFLGDDHWVSNVPVFTGKRNPELVMTIYGGSTLHMAAEHFVTCLVLGGVFERHPTLRFGAIETGGYWLGPLAERLDLWAEFYRRQVADTISRAPSEYIADNVRVTPFYFEDVASYFQRFPHLQSCYCYSTDYPHREGGKRSKQVAYERLRPLGDDLVRNYFVTNGSWLLPD